MFALKPAVLGFLTIGFLNAQDAQGQTSDVGPLSVIDWLDKPAPLTQLPRAPILRTAVPRQLDEPAVTQDGTAPTVTTRPLGPNLPQTIGLVSAGITGLSADVWAGSDTARVARQIAALPDLELPAANALLFTLLLSEARAADLGPETTDTLTRARVEKLMALGAVDPAMALLEQAGARTSRTLFPTWADLTLIVGTEDEACGALTRAPYLTQDSALRIFCAARGGDWETAALTFGSAQALSLLPREKLDVLDRFLNPDIYEDADPLPVPRRIDPLTFRLFETIGEALPTGPMPRAYAVADLRDIAGWKSQLEAAERLTRTGALPDNQLLGLYTDRKAAASGGIWDRVRAVQRFDTALSTRSGDAVSKTLPEAWQQIAGAGLQVSFATVFYDQLKDLPLTGSAAPIRARMSLLTPDYEQAARRLEQTPDILGDDTALLRAVALGEAPTGPAPKGALHRAIHDAFTTPEPRARWVEMAQNTQLGEALLATLGTLRDGARGDSRALRDALGTLRILGFEDTARRASLQILLLERAS